MAQQTQARWTVDDVKPAESGASRRYGYGFNIMNNQGMGPRLLLQLAYDTKDDATKARELIAAAISTATDIAHS